MRKHSVAKSKVAVLDALFPWVRQHILGTISRRADQMVVPQGTGASSRYYPIQLAEEGLAPTDMLAFLRRRRDRTRRCFRAEPGSPTSQQSARHFRERHRKTAKDLRLLCRKRLRPLPTVSRELLSRYNREKLHKEVSSGPIQKLAAAYGLWDDTFCGPFAGN